MHILAGHGVGMPGRARRWSGVSLYGRKLTAISPGFRFTRVQATPATHVVSVDRLGCTVGQRHFSLERLPRAGAGEFPAAVPVTANNRVRGFYTALSGTLARTELLRTVRGGPMPPFARTAKWGWQHQRPITHSESTSVFPQIRNPVRLTLGRRGVSNTIPNPLSIITQRFLPNASESIPYNQTLTALGGHSTLTNLVDCLELYLLG